MVYDLLFTAYAPSTKEPIKLIINVEAQNGKKPKYPIIKRGLYYASRLISSQYGKEFTHSAYDKIKKVYSIWICTHLPKYKQNTMLKYSINESCLCGGYAEDPQNYDLIDVIIINLGDEDKAKGIIRLLSSLLTSVKTSSERKAILSDEYGIKMTEKYEREVYDMCNVSYGFEAIGIEKGMEKGIVISIKNLMSSLQLTAEQAMNLLKVPESDRPTYRAALEQ